MNEYRVAHFDSRCTNVNKMCSSAAFFVNPTHMRHAVQFKIALIGWHLSILSFNRFTSKVYHYREILTCLPILKFARLTVINFKSFAGRPWPIGLRKNARLWCVAIHGYTTLIPSLKMVCSSVNLLRSIFDSAL